MNFELGLVFCMQPLTDDRCAILSQLMMGKTAAISTAYGKFCST